MVHPCKPKASLPTNRKGFRMLRGILLQDHANVNAGVSILAVKWKRVPVKPKPYSQTPSPMAHQVLTYALPFSVLKCRRIVKGLRLGRPPPLHSFNLSHGWFPPGCPSPSAAMQSNFTSLLIPLFSVIYCLKMSKPRFW